RRCRSTACLSRLLTSTRAKYAASCCASSAAGTRPKYNLLRIRITVRVAMCFEFGASQSKTGGRRRTRVARRPPTERVMKAVRFYDYGGPEVLRYEQVDRPSPAEGQVLVRVAATSFNLIDAVIRAGTLLQVFPVTLPFTPGIDVAGSVEALGDQVAGWSI